MAHSRLYRSFLILQEAEKGYSIASDKPISAYTKIEGKSDSCRISFYAQNLKRDNYHMLLICGKRDVNKNISLGPLNINEQGRAEVSGDYDINNIAGTGIPMNSISGAAIVILNDNQIKVIMKGYMNGEKMSREWSDFPIIKQSINLGEQAPPVEENLPQREEVTPQDSGSPKEEQQTSPSKENLPQREEEISPSATVSPEVEQPPSLEDTIPQRAVEVENESNLEERVEKDEGSEKLLEDLTIREEAEEAVNKKVNIIGSRNSSEISLEELQVLKAFIKEQELRFGIVQKDEEENHVPENIIENIEMKFSIRYPRK